MIYLMQKEEDFLDKYGITNLNLYIKNMNDRWKIESSQLSFWFKSQQDEQKKSLKASLN